MTGQWRRIGRLDLDTSRAPWAASHAALPVAEPISSGCWNLYLSLRDDQDRARIGRARLTLYPTPRLTALEPDPILDLGPLGAFDDSGVLSACLVKVGTRRFLFYTGWSRGVTVPFYLAIGLATSDDGGPFQRQSQAPVLGRNAADPFLTASPAVLIEGELWRMWYVSASRWQATPTTPRHYYNIRYAESDDGIAWRPSGIVCLDYSGPDEYAFSRASVIREDDRYRMWYAVRGSRNHIRHAESRDGLNWTKCADEAGLSPSPSGWDDEMVEYPCIIDDAGTRYMLYNGNGYGETGVGIACWVPTR